MKPLTIEELKALEVGDWVWIDFGADYIGKYCRKVDNSRTNEFIYDTIWDCRGAVLAYSKYGTKWLAYKNKEQAEAKGEIVELPYKVERLYVGDTVYYIQEYWNEATLQHEKQVKKTIIDYIAKDYIEVDNGVWLSPNQFWLTPKQAEARLQELRGEK